jgi:hypothetical protein
MLQCCHGEAEKTGREGCQGGWLRDRPRAFSKISSVEGIHLTQIMEKRASEAGRKGLTAEEYRRTIVRSYRKG